MEIGILSGFDSLTTKGEATADDSTNEFGPDGELHNRWPLIKREHMSAHVMGLLSLLVNIHGEPHGLGLLHADFSAHTGDGVSKLRRFFRMDMGERSGVEHKPRSSGALHDNIKNIY